VKRDKRTMEISVTKQTPSNSWSEYIILRKEKGQRKEGKRESVY
jgi:hypothetical protein